MRCLSITGVSPSIKFAGAHLYTWLERGTVRVTCLVQEHNTMSLVRAQTWTAKSGGEYTNNEANTMPPHSLQYLWQHVMRPTEVSIIFSMQRKPKLFLIAQNGFPKKNKCTFKKVHLGESTNFFTAKSALTAFFACWFHVVHVHHYVLVVYRHLHVYQLSWIMIYM